MVLLASGAASTQQSGKEPPSTLRAPSRAELLRGEYGRYRANNDLLHYDLDVRIDPEKKSISGRNTVRFKMLKDDTRIQLELYANLTIDRIVFNTRELKYTRERNTVYIDFPETLRSGRTYAIDFHYSGTPLEVGRFDALAFKKDPAGGHWINTANEGVGSSVWWPSKDQWRDEPEGMEIKVSVPNGLTNVSNGRFIAKTDLGDGYTKWHYRVHYPINSYNVSLNIANYVHFGETMGDLTLDYYVLPANLDKAKKQFAQVEADDGGVPEILRRVPVQEGRLQADRSAVLRDGAPERGHLREPLREWLSRARLDRRWRQPQVRLHHHPRERARVVRQRRVGRRAIRHVDPRRLGDVSRVPLRRAHVRLRRCAEVHQRLQDEDRQQGADHRAARHRPRSEPGSVFQGRALPPHASQRCQRRRAKWFKLIRDVYDEFKYRNVMTEEMVAFVNKQLGQDLTPIFDQYLRRPELPVLQLTFDEKEQLAWYRWNAGERAFAMPIRVGDPANWQTDSTHHVGVEVHAVAGNERPVQSRYRSVLRLSGGPRCRWPACEALASLAVI